MIKNIVTWFLRLVIGFGYGCIIGLLLASLRRERRSLVLGILGHMKLWNALEQWPIGSAFRSMLASIMSSMLHCSRLLLGLLRRELQYRCLLLFMVVWCRLPLQCCALAYIVASGSC